MPNEPIRILNVDDDAANRYALTRTLQKAGYEVVESGTGADALRLAREHPALILLDVKLPDISGFEVCRIIKSDPDLQMIPVLHLSASYVSTSDKVQGLEGGADGYLIKPVEPPELIATVRALMRMYAAEAVMRAHQVEIESLNERLRRAISETHHRVKNNLQIIGALVDLQAMEDTDTVPMAEMRRLGMHVRTLAMIHDMLTTEVKSNAECDTVSVAAAVNRLLPLIRATAGARRIEAQVQDTALPVRLIASLSLLINELISNAVKHGGGDITLAFTADAGVARLEVRDNGPGFPPGFEVARSANIGLELIISTARHDLAGEVRLDAAPDGGARVAVTFPVPTR